MVSNPKFSITKKNYKKIVCHLLITAQMLDISFKVMPHNRSMLYSI